MANSMIEDTDFLSQKDLYNKGLNPGWDKNSTEGKICGIIFDQAAYLPEDVCGCHLKVGHEGPHEFKSTDGNLYQWETDFDCTCEHCMLCEGDYCSTVWKVE